MAVLSLYLVLAWAALFTGSVVFRAGAGFVGVIFVTAFLAFYKIRVWAPLGLALLLLTFSLVNPTPDKASPAFFLVALLSSFCISIVVRDFDLGLVGIKIPLFLFASYLLFLVLVKGFNPNDFNEVFSGYSRNGVGAILLALMAGYVWYCYEKETPPSALLLFLCFALMFPLYGRANIVFGAVIFGLGFGYRYGAAVSTVITFLATFCLLLLSSSVYDYLMVRTNFSSGLESARSVMLNDYWQWLDLPKLIFGGNLLEIESIRDYGGNPHNAFLRAHAFFGFPALILVAILIFLLMMLTVFGRWLLVGLGLVFLGRAFLDIIYFGNIFDYLMVGPFLYFLRPEKVKLVI